MPLNLSIFKAGQFTATNGGVTTDYTVASPATSAIVANIRALNVGSFNGKVTIRLKRSGGSFSDIWSIEIASGVSAIFNTELTLAVGDSIQVMLACTVSGSTTGFHCLVCGATRV